MADRPNQARARAIMARMPVQPIALRLHGVIDGDGRLARHGEAITAKEVAAALRRDRHAPVVASIDTGGGFTDEAMRIYEELRAHRGAVTATVNARCHSAGGLLLVAADHRKAKPNARFLLHTAAIDHQDVRRLRLDAKGLRIAADGSERVTRQMIAIYAKRCGAPVAWFAKAVAEDRTIGAMGALNCGLINAITGLEWIKPTPPRMPVLDAERMTYAGR